MPKISVIMPFYNCEKFLDASISSILGQTFSDFEFIIINDASTDTSDTVVSQYLSDPRIIYIKNSERKGIVYNLNHAFDYVHSDIVARMDGDDMSHVTRLEKQYQFLQDNPSISIVGSFLKVIDEKGKPIYRIINKPISPEGIRQKLVRFLTIFHASSMIRKDVYNSIGYYTQECLYFEDLEWTYRAIYGGFLGANIPEVLYYYRYHSNSSNKHASLLARKIYAFKKEMKKKFSLRYNFLDYFIIYCQFFLGCSMPARRVQYVEYIVKKYL